MMKLSSYTCSHRWTRLSSLLPPDSPTKPLLGKAAKSLQQMTTMFIVFVVPGIRTDSWCKFTFFDCRKHTPWPCIAKGNADISGKYGSGLRKNTQLEAGGEVRTSQAVVTSDFICLWRRCNMISGDLWSGRQHWMFLSHLPLLQIYQSPKRRSSTWLARPFQFCFQFDYPVFLFAF